MKKNHRSTLIPSSLFKRNFRSFLFLLLFSVMLTYSLSSIVYFTNLVVASGNSNKYEFGVIIQNLLFAGLTALATWTFIRFLDYRIKNSFLKYILLFVGIEILMFFGSYFTYLYIWQDLGDYNRNGSISPSASLGILSGITPGFVGILYYYFWKASQQVNQKIDEQEVRLLQLEQNKAKAELAALEARINPHFLYNALNSIASLIHEKPDTAEEMTMNLSKLFRKTTGKNSETFCTLKEEIKLVKTYMEIEQIRFGDRLAFSANIPSEFWDIKVPTFIIQPLVENAIKHGLSQITGKGSIEINAEQMNGSLMISVHDNGPAFTIGENTGYGLMSIQEKLQLLYGETGKLMVNNEPRKEVIIEIPL